MNMSIFKRLRKKRKALMLFELLLGVLILGTLFGIGIPVYRHQLEKAKVIKAVTDIYTFSTNIYEYYQDHETFPESLADVGRDKNTDPWGKPYQYLKIEGKSKKDIKGKWRKDRSLVPINSDFDLYSMGKDKKSTAPLTAQDSRDDVVRANNGAYIGLASKY
jgi:general secretion pathway protein G